MARVQHIETVALADPDGTLKALAGVQVFVYSAGTQVTVPIYTLRTGGMPINNTMITDDTGRIVFFAETGEYELRLLDTQVPPRIADQTQSLSLVDATVDTSDIAAEAVTLAKLDLGVQAALFTPGDLKATARSSAPAGWLMCDGAAVSRSTYAALFAAIGMTYGVGDGSTTFGLPDLRGRVPVGVDGAAGRLDALDALGQSGGAQKHTLTTAEMPSHRHTVGTSLTFQSGSLAYGVMYNNDDGPPVAFQRNTSLVGGGGAHNNMQPYGVVNYMVKA